MTAAKQNTSLCRAPQYCYISAFARTARNLFTMTIKLHDTRQGRKVPFEPLRPGDSLMVEYPIPSDARYVSYARIEAASPENLGLHPSRASRCRRNYRPRRSDAA